MKTKLIALFILFLILCSSCTNNPESSVKINKTLPAPVQGTPIPTPAGPSFTLTPNNSGPSFTFTPTDSGPSFTFTPTDSGPSFTFTPTDSGPSHTFTPTESSPYYTFTPTESGPSITFTPTPVGVYFIPNANINCRFGPDRVLNIIDIALKGQSYLINGRNYANDWYYLKFTSNEYCYVLATTGAASGDTSKVRVMLPISTPTVVISSSTSCSDFTSETTCNAQSNCKWRFTGYPSWLLRQKITNWFYPCFQGSPKTVGGYLP